MGKENIIIIISKNLPRPTAEGLPLLIAASSAQNNITHSRAQISPNIDPRKAPKLPAAVQIATKLKVSLKKLIIDPMAPIIINIRAIQKSILGPPNCHLPSLISSGVKLAIFSTSLYLSIKYLADPL